MEVLLMVVVVIIVLVFVTKLGRASDERRDADLEQRAKRVRYLRQCAAETRELLDALPARVTEASKRLDRSVILFEERAFIGFWDSLEYAAESLRDYVDDLRAIADSVDRYKAGANAFEPEEPQASPLRIRIEDIPQPESMAPLYARLVDLRAKAERDFQFASIFEQRRATRTLERGFSTLNQTIVEMKEQLLESQQEVRDAIGSLHDTTRKGFGDVTAAVNDAAAQVTSAVDAADGSQTRRDRAALKVLRKIQRK